VPDTPKAHKFKEIAEKRTPGLPRRAP